MVPETVASWVPCRRPMSHWGTTTWVASGAALTADGAGPSHRVRRSRHFTDGPSPVRCHDGGAETSALGGGAVVVGDTVVADTLLRATDGDRRFSNTAAGPTRRYGSPC